MMIFRIIIYSCFKFVYMLFISLNSNKKKEYKYKYFIFYANYAALSGLLASSCPSFNIFTIAS